MSLFGRALFGQTPERRSLSLADLDALMDQSYGPGQTTTTGQWIDTPTAMTSAVVYACVNVLAQTIAALPLLVYRRRPDGGKERAPEHRLFPLLHHAPNPEMTAYELRACLVGHVCLWGNAYCEIERSDAGVNGLWPLRPDRMTPTRDADNALVYDYRLPDGTLKRFQFAQIMHWRGLSTNGIIGYSPIRQGAESIALDMATRQTGNRFFGNDARPGGILKTAATLSDPARANLKTSWESAHGGLTQKSRVAVLEQGIEWQQIGIPPEEAQFLETRRYGRSEIAALYRVPLHMINDLERATFSNIEHQSLEFVTFTLVPWLVQIEQSIKRDLFAISDGKRAYFAEHLVEGLLRGDIASRYQAYATGRNWGWLSANDVRKLENQNPLPGDEGDMYLVPANMMDVAHMNDAPEPAAAPLPEPEPDEDADAADDGRPAPDDGGEDETTTD